MVAPGEKWDGHRGSGAPAQEPCGVHLGTFGDLVVTPSERSESGSLTAFAGSARVLAVTDTVDALLDEYHRRYVERDAEGVTDLCLWPFLAIRKGEAIHLPDRNAVRDHFASMVQTYRFAGVDSWRRVETDVRPLGEHSFFVTVNWNTVDSEGEVLRGSWTSYQMLATPNGWRFLSYTNHF